MAIFLKLLFVIALIGLIIASIFGNSVNYTQITYDMGICTVDPTSWLLILSGFVGNTMIMLCFWLFYRSTHE